MFSSGVSVLRNSISQWEVKSTEQKQNFMCTSIVPRVYFTREKALLGGIQNHADEDADRKTNFFLCIKCFRNPKTNLFILGVGEG